MTYKSFRQFMEAVETQLDEVLQQVDKDGEKKWALVSKTSGKVLAYYDGEGKPSDDWVASHEKRIQYFKHQNG